MAPTKNPTPKVDEVKARFGGRDLTFKIERLELGQFEQAYNAAAVTTFQRFADGRWSVGDIGAILNWAAPNGFGKRPHGWEGDVDPIMSTIFTRHYLQERAAKFRGDKPKLSFVDATIEANGHAKYAVLAQGILAAALFGIPEDSASFSDEEVEAVDDPA